MSTTDIRAIAQEALSQKEKERAEKQEKIAKRLIERTVNQQPDCKKLSKEKKLR